MNTSNNGYDLINCKIDEDCPGNTVCFPPNNEYDRGNCSCSTFYYWTEPQNFCSGRTS
jgi:hypothetical protein